MPRDPLLQFRPPVPPETMRRGNLLAAHGVAGPAGQALDVLRLALEVGLSALEGATGADPAPGLVRLARKAGAKLGGSEEPQPLRPVPEDAPPAVRALVADVAANGGKAGLLELSPSPKPRAKRKPRALAPERETPVQIGWRTWRAAYEVHYHRPYSDTGGDGATMARLSKLARDMIDRLDMGDVMHDGVSSLELLFVHRWRRYLADPGHAAHPGDTPFLRDKAHGLQWVERGIPAYGTPWDKATAKGDAGPGVAPPKLAGRRQYAGRPGS